MSLFTNEIACWLACAFYVSIVSRRREFRLRSHLQTSQGAQTSTFSALSKIKMSQQTLHDS